MHMRMICGASHTGSHVGQQTLKLHVGINTNSGFVLILDIFRTLTKVWLVQTSQKCIHMHMICGMLHNGSHIGQQTFKMHAGIPTGSVHFGLDHIYIKRRQKSCQPKPGRLSLHMHMICGLLHTGSHGCQQTPKMHAGILTDSAHFDFYLGILSVRKLTQRILSRCYCRQKE